MTNNEMLIMEYSSDSIFYIVAILVALYMAYQLISSGIRLYRLERDIKKSRANNDELVLKIRE